jgi:hypothetical protein
MGWLKRRIIEELEPTMAEWERRWIPVDEALPETDVDMVMLTDGKWITFGRRSGEGWYVHEDAEALGPASLDRFTHWMPLPAPPQTGK